MRIKQLVHVQIDIDKAPILNGLHCNIGGMEIGNQGLFLFKELHSIKVVDPDGIVSSLSNLKFTTV